MPKYSLLSFTIFFDLEEIKIENFNIFENNIISVELAKVLEYFVYTERVVNLGGVCQVRGTRGLESRLLQSE